MPKAVKHETDKGKWQSSFDDYAHGEGNGKSRTAIYKHFKRMQEMPEPEIVEEEIPVVETDDNWKSASWLDDSEEVDVKTKTIPEPLADMASGKIREMDMKAQGQVVRSMFVGLDRLITHWGRGVMSDNKWTIDRSPEDYDVLENATVQMLAYYDVRIPISPPMIWGVTVGSAYVPQITHVVKNRDPLRKRRNFLPRWLRRKPKKTLEVNENE